MFDSLSGGEHAGVTDGVCLGFTPTNLAINC